MIELGTVRTEVVLKSATGRAVQTFNTPEEAVQWNERRARESEARGAVVPHVRFVKRTIIEEEVLV